MINTFTEKLGRDISVRENAEQSALICQEEQISVIPFCEETFNVLKGSGSLNSYDPNWVYETCIANQCTISVTNTGICSGLTSVKIAPEIYGENSIVYLFKNRILSPCTSHILACRKLVEGDRAVLDYYTAFFRSGPEKYDEYMLNSIDGIQINKSGCGEPLTAGILKCPQSGGRWEYSYLLGRPGLPGNISLMPGAFLNDYGRPPEMYRVNDQGTKKGGRVQERLLDPILEGDRNNEITKRAGVFYGTHKMGFEKGLAYLLELNRAVCKPPLSHEEVKRTAWSIFKKASQNVR